MSRRCRLIRRACLPDLRRAWGHPAVGRPTRLIGLRDVLGGGSMSEIHGAVGSYVVNALDAEKLEEFEAHLAVCSTCTREVQEFSEMAAEFIAARATQPPPRTTQGSLRPT